MWDYTGTQTPPLHVFYTLKLVHLLKKLVQLGCITQGSLVEILAEPLVGDFHKRTLKNWCTIWRPHSVCSDDSRGGVNGRMVAWRRHFNALMSVWHWSLKWMQIDCCSWKLPSTHNWMTRAVDAVVFLQHVQNSFGTALSNCVQKGVQKSNDNTATQSQCTRQTVRPSPQGQFKDLPEWTDYRKKTTQIHNHTWTD